MNIHGSSLRGAVFTLVAIFKGAYFAFLENDFWCFLLPIAPCGGETLPGYNGTRRYHHQVRRERLSNVAMFLDAHT